MPDIAFVLPFHDRSWLGGINYFKCLFRSLEIIGRNSRVVAYLPSIAPEEIFGEFSSVSRRRYQLLRRNIVARVGAEVAGRLGVPSGIESQLIADNISTVSHSGWYSRNSRLRTIGWLADCQHVEMPSLFSSSEQRARNRGFSKTLDRCDRTIFSSHAAMSVATRTFACDHSRLECLHFAKESNFIPSGYSKRAADIRERYGIQGGFVYMPNQFWKHKNHKQVILAISYARETLGREISVVCTGNTSDRRNPEHLSYLLRLVDELGVRDSFKVLGVVPWSDVQSLYESCVAVLNPSEYEGWSSSLEEARALGKLVIASRLAVHEEQAPDRVRYFDVGDVPGLANCMIDAMEKFNASEDLDYMSCGVEKALRRMVNFGESYFDIVERSA